MKKFVWLAVALAVVLGVIFLRPQTKPVMVKTKTLYETTVQEIVTCKGKVEKSGDTTITLSNDVVIDEVMVQKGDTVKRGDVLFTVDTTASLQLLADTDSALAVQAAMNGSFEEQITAPCDGTVSTLVVREGVVLEQGKTAAEIEGPQAVRIRLSIPERHIRSIQQGQAVTVTGVGFYKTAYSGTISEIATTAKSAVNGAVAETVVEAVVTLEDGQTDDSLRVGLNAVGTVTIASVPHGFILPYTAVEQDENGAEFVYILQGDTAQKRVITPYTERADGYVVTEGFSQGEVLILSPELVGDAPLQKEDADGGTS